MMATLGLKSAHGKIDESRCDTRHAQKGSRDLRALADDKIFGTPDDITNQ